MKIEQKIVRSRFGWQCHTSQAWCVHPIFGAETMVSVCDRFAITRRGIERKADRVVKRLQERERWEASATIRTFE